MPEKTKPKVRRVKISDLVTDPGNVRIHPERNRLTIRGSLRRFGAARSLVADKDLVVRAGNGTLIEAMEEGIEEAIVIETDGKQLVVVQRPDWDDRQASQYAVADNRTGESAGWDWELLAGELERQLEEIGEEGLAEIGWLDHEISPILAADWTPGGEGSLADHEHGHPGGVIKPDGVQRRVIDDAVALLNERDGTERKTAEAVAVICQEWIDAQREPDA